MNTTKTESEAETKINDWANQYNISANFEFVPHSLSRNATQKQPSLNWKVTLYHNNREFIRFDYSAGMGHAPSYKQHMTQDELNTVKNECEKGRTGRYMKSLGVHSFGKPIAPPKLADVLYSISMDASAIDYATFEEWAPEMGYDADSRKGEAIYRTCLEYALKLRGAVGDKAMEQLRTATQDY